MKMMWETPKIEVQAFAANDAVTVCYSLYCAIPGTDHTHIDDGTTPKWFGKDGDGKNGYSATGDVNSWGGFNPVEDNQLHGSCAEGSSYNEETGMFYENGKGSTVYSVQIGAQVENMVGWWYAIWSSIDVNGTGNYNHYGYAVNDSEDQPNHS